MTLREEVFEAEKKAMRKRVFLMLRSLYTLFRGSATDTGIVDKYMNIWNNKFPPCSVACQNRIVKYRLHLLFDFHTIV